jgi:hypothetical protein
MQPSWLDARGALERVVPVPISIRRRVKRKTLQRSRL